MSDIDKIYNLFKLKSAFKNVDEVFHKLSNQITDPNVKDNITRFEKGFTVENYFACIYSMLPYVKLVHGLEQKQYPEQSKSQYQVPDFNVIYKSFKGKDLSVLIEVKSSNKENISLMKKQIDCLISYSEKTEIPILFAIHWIKFNMWTINAIDVFKKKKNEYVINMHESLKNDISIVFGDFYCMFNKEFYRKKYYDKNIEKELVFKNKEYGNLVKVEISLDNSNFEEIDAMESAVIDSFVKIKVVDISKDNTKTMITEMNSTQSMPRFSHLIMRYIGMFNAEITEKLCLFTGHMIYNFMSKIKAGKFHTFPKLRSYTNDNIMKRSFSDNSETLKRYFGGRN
ncbi:MAG TPA: hypothetical protein PKE39_09430 [Ignavibacteria bacterium]|nr:hypothetical protein [Ignavibacteria bacterium]HMQ99232.1 hypothetical protein [Ignavibacteria bacterium]